MALPDKVETHVRDWLRDERQDTLTAFVRVITSSILNPDMEMSNSVSVADLRVPVEALGRQLSDMAWLPGKALALVVSPGSFRTLRLSGWKERVKEAMVEAPLNDVLVHHLDQTSPTGHGIRYFVVDLPDGRWLADSLVYTKKNGDRAPFAQHADDFIAALASKATAIE